MEQKISFLRIYILYTLIAMAVIGTVFTVQVLFVHKEFKFIYLIAPFILSLIIGLLLSTLIYLRKRLHKKTHMMHALVDMAPELSCIEDENGNVVFASHAAYDITGYPAEAFTDDPGLFETLIVDEDREKYREFRSTIEQHDEHHSIELRIRDKSGTPVWIEYYCSAIYDEQHKITAFRSTSLNISKRKAYELEIRHLAEYDPLTELPNRRFMHEKIAELIGNGADSQSDFAVMFVDLDRFKYVNDTHGHSFGDKLLHDVAMRLKNDLPFTHFISRFGGDEFILILPEVESREDAHSKAQQLLEIISREFVVSGINLHVDASIGIACFPEHGHNCESLVKNADTAMYHAKQSADNNICFFQHTQFEDSKQFLQIEHQMRQAIRNGAFTLHYQPQFDIRSMEMTGVESLARWLAEDGKPVVSPMQFIPVAEETGMIIALGTKLLKLALDQQSAWRTQGYDFKVSYNVSASQFASYAFYDMLIAELKEHDIPMECFEIEITENVLIKETEEQLDLIDRFREKKISIALDDFGTGFSSISYLRNLSSNILKIDKKFIDTITVSERDKNLVGAMISLAHSFGMQVIAEGIETQEQLELLRELGCDQGQGYLYSRPISGEQLVEFMKTVSLSKFS